ncbi:tumor protein p63-regulated gene 1-like protein isoform X1 [Parasteatoda tepidariorum]|uniref:tumor protein p63-regulated gene 1-like protein isoform X1 n=1 Tax=Parasteatoda tepidariorum TaxID=114398 RepID=UPI001C71CAAD|nr:tumor protein p63-regulated gene 1-like protein isoform X1 [Parasteatoda tepidariorum]
MANSKNYTDVGLNNDRNLNISNSSPSSDFDRLEDCNEAEFRGATLSLSRETSPPESVAAAGLDDLNGNVGAEASGDDKRRPSSTRLARSTNVQDFFAVREGALQKAAEQCRPVLLDHMDGDLRGIWLLTEIDHWDTEKERLLFLTEKSLISLKYDFITLKLLEYQRYDLKKFSQIVIGELKYPEKSLMPKINGAMDFLKQRIIPKLRVGRNFRQPVEQNPAKMTVVASRPRSAVARNELGVQCSWGSLEQIPALKRWNPWSREIPWATYTSHPLFKMDTAEKTNYNIEDFSKTLVNTLSEGSNSATPMASPSTPLCKVLYQPIIIESYAGLAAALHNANELGFFKSRGKVSF